MRKDIEWLVQMIDSERESLRKRFESGKGTHNETTFNEGMGWALSKVLKMIYQLDKPEALSQEWIRNNQERKGVHFFVNVTKLQNLLVPKQEELETKIHELIESYKQEEDAYSNPENGWISGFIEDLKNLVEEEPLYYALVKGHELITDEGDLTCKYWNLNTSNGDVFPSNRFSESGKFLIEMSKSEWNKLGISESNADFVKVEE